MQVKTELSKRLPVLMLGVLTGCGSASGAPDFPKVWKPVNELPEHPQAIALSPPHVYRATHLDATVKSLLSRWADEAKLPVVYAHTHDFTLFKPVLAIRQTDLKAALAELSDLYRQQNIVFEMSDGAVMAGPVPDAPPPVREGE